ncbi:MAG: hypothetical protein IID45_02130 [Planctomycetes bacterium]|nr:hypothetical protein [Planctomycetota bacterium]
MKYRLSLNQLSRVCFLVVAVALSNAGTWSSVAAEGQTPSRGSSAAVRVAGTKTFPVTVVPIEGLIRKPANLCDLKGKTLHFTLQKDGTYRTKTTDSAKLLDCPKPLRPSAVSLKFKFPFSGKTWDKVYVNRHGNVSFLKSETLHWEQRNPWPDAGMLSMAAAFDMRSRMGKERMIAAFWNHYSYSPYLTRIRVRSEKDVFAVTWNVTCNRTGFTPLGQNIFQLRLRPNGDVEMAYSHLAEKDGIVGLFTGTAAKGQRLDSWKYTGKIPHPSVALDTAEIYDEGSLLRLVFNMKEPLVTGAEAANLIYRFWFRSFGYNRIVEVRSGTTYSSLCQFGQHPALAGFRTTERTVEIYLSKVLLGSAKSLQYAVDVVWFGKKGRFVQLGFNRVGSMRLLDLKRALPGTIDFSSPSHRLSGNLFEVFHYPSVTKHRYEILQEVYRAYPPVDDFVLVTTDFRIDSIHAHGSGSPPMNTAIKGIGKTAHKPGSTAKFGTTRLQMAMVTFWIGADMFSESGSDRARRYFNFGRAVGWVGHEAVHRWGMGLKFKHPKTGKITPLADSKGHWLEGLNTASYARVSHRYQKNPAAERSLMGGSAWIENSDGTYSKSGHVSMMPAGFSALDLYAMGLLAPRQVPDTFLLENLKKAGLNRYRGDKVPVRIEDVIAAMGPRVPSSKTSKKHFTMAVYLVHPKGRPVDEKMLNRAGGLATAVMDFFLRATAGRMTVSATR